MYGHKFYSKEKKLWETKCVCFFGSGQFEQYIRNQVYTLATHCTVLRVALIV